MLPLPARSPLRTSRRANRAERGEPETGDSSSLVATENTDTSEVSALPTSLPVVLNATDRGWSSVCAAPDSLSPATKLTVY